MNMQWIAYSPRRNQSTWSAVLDCGHDVLLYGEGRVKPRSQLVECYRCAPPHAAVQLALPLMAVGKIVPGRAGKGRE